MKQAKVHKSSLALVVLFSLVGLFETTNYAQQATPTPRANGAASSASDRDPKTASVPKDKVVIKVGSQQVTAADFDFLFQTLNAQDQKTLATQGKQPLADQYILTLVLEQQALRDHLDATADFLSTLGTPDDELPQGNPALSHGPAAPGFPSHPSERLQWFRGARPVRSAPAVAARSPLPAGRR